MKSYPHWCALDHEEIGHSDSEHEECPLCRVKNELSAAQQAIKWLWSASAYTPPGFVAMAFRAAIEAEDEKD